MYGNIESINLNNFNRLFTFGCSFTNYIWPTWADMLAIEMPHAEHINLGLSGGGNLFISSKISESDRKYHFCSTDLVVVMWTSIPRDDKWVKELGGWVRREIVDEPDFDRQGYFIRDLSLINLTDSYLGNSKCTAIQMKGINLDAQQDPGDQLTAQVINSYKPVLDRILPGLYELEMNSQWNSDYKYFSSNNQSFTDYHPHPSRYRNYLKLLGWPLTNISLVYAEHSTKLLLECKTEEEIILAFNSWKKAIAGRMTSY